MHSDAWVVLDSTQFDATRLTASLSSATCWSWTMSSRSMLSPESLPSSLLFGLLDSIRILLRSCISCPLGASSESPSTKGSMPRITPGCAWRAPSSSPTPPASRSRRFGPFSPELAPLPALPHLADWEESSDEGSYLRLPGDMGDVTSLGNSALNKALSYRTNVYSILAT